MALNSKVGKSQVNPYRFFKFRFFKFGVSVAPFVGEYLSSGQIITNDKIAPGTLPNSVEQIKFIILTKKNDRSTRVFYPNDFIAQFGDKVLGQILTMLV
jgi:hypothetical protein